MAPAVLSSAFAEGYLDVLRSGVFSDFKIICDGHEFKVHRAIICATWKYFSKVCAPGFVFKEVSEASETLGEVDPTILGRVILYQYTKSYDAGEAEDHLSVHVKVYACADRLVIEDLKEYACKSFVDIAGHMKMDLWVDPFYGKLLRNVYESTLLEITEKEESKSKGPTGLGCTTNGLRYAATMCAISNQMSGLKGSGIENAMKEHEPMAWGVAQVVRVLIDKLKTAQRTVENAERANVHASQQLSRRGPEQVAYAKRVVEKLQNNLKWARKCAGCNKDFRVGAITIEGELSLTGSVQVVVNCRVCQMRLMMQV